MSNVDTDVPLDLRSAARAMAARGLSDAFGHVSVRVSADSALITPAVPLGSLGPEHELVTLSLEPGAPLPDRAPREAWIHLALLADDGYDAVCRAQPPAVTAFAALDIPLPVLSGHTAMLGPVAVHDDSRLVRDAETAGHVARALGDGQAIVLRGNGAVTRASSPANAVAAMWVLERSAETALRALAAGAPRELPADETAWWRGRVDELLPRIAAYLMNEGAAPQ